MIAFYGWGSTISRLQIPYEETFYYLPFNNSIKFLLRCVLIKFLYWTPFLFFSFRLLYLSTQFLCLLTCLSLEFSVAFHLEFHLLSEFLIIVVFRMLRKLITVNKATFSLQQILIKTTVKHRGASCIRMSLHHKEN